MSNMDSTQQLTIPIDYMGWFEVLSEDGKSVRPLQSIKELLAHFTANNSAKSKTKPVASYLVRENINAYSLSPAKVLLSSTSSNNNPTQSHHRVFNFSDLKKSLVKLGDKLNVSADCVSSENTDIYVEITNELNLKLRKRLIKFTLERAQSALSGLLVTETIYVPDDSRGKFSPVARCENIAGVHQLRDIIAKFKLPITVQLVHPSALSTATLQTWNYHTATHGKSGNSSTFSPVFRLLKMHQVDNMVAYPISGEKDSPSPAKLIKIPCYTNVRFIRAANMNELLCRSSYYLKFMLSECDKRFQQILDEESCAQLSYFNLNKPSLDYEAGLGNYI